MTMVTGASFLADGLSTAGSEHLNPLEIVPGAVFLGGAAWNLVLTYLQVYRPVQQAKKAVGQLGA